MPEYNPDKYIRDPEYPEFTCSICDKEEKDSRHLEEHLILSHSVDELAYHVRILQDYTWRQEKLIRKLTGKQSYEVI